MNNVINDNGEALNANFKVVTIDNELGLTLESRNGLQRNRDYNEALELILYRLKKADIEKIRLKVVSATLMKHFPNPIDRTVKLNNKPEILLVGKDINKLRKQIGSAASKLKVDNSTKGGNPTKRIHLVSEYLKEKEWIKIAFGISNKEEEIKETEFFDYNKFEEEVIEYLKKPIKNIPEGNSKPRKKINVSQEVYERDSEVKAWILQNAKGKCEYCKADGPFTTSNGIPYLEVHHLKTLADGGSDTIDNTVALCPNCHREFHYGINKYKILTRMYDEIKRLKKED